MDDQDPMIVSAFVKKFGTENLAMPDIDATCIKQLAENGRWKEAFVRLVDYTGTKQNLRDEVENLSSKNIGLREEIRDLKKSNDAEHAETLKYMDMVSVLLTMARWFLDHTSPNDPDGWAEYEKTAKFYDEHKHLA